ncbi:MAG: hypothetical protein J2P50_18550, partial [Hyphomicrobiaceae bacterium]|nr:hypothetical protein [Hyphomicrobiaceae bacterium]
MDDTAGNAGEHTPAQPQEPADEGVGAPRPEPAEAHPSGPAPPDIGLAAPGDPDEATGSVTTLGQPATTSRMEGEDHAAPVLAGISRPEADDGAQAGPDRDKPETCPRTERVEAHEPFQEYLEGRVRKPSDSDAAAEAGQVDNDAGQELPQDSIAGAQGPALSAELAD